uniref:Imm32 family immunity protein n=1 Tax=Microbulbifer mangrovi TaxID=927787 RepID=UPI00195E92C0
AAPAGGVNQYMKIFGYSRHGDETLLELAEATISASPEALRDIASFLLECADGIEKGGESWEHEHFKSQDVSAPRLIVYNSASE